jgi:hypothetical protein
MADVTAEHGEGRWDIPAIRAGASVALVFAVPFSIAARIVSGSDAAIFLVFLATVGFFLGSAVAAWHQQRGTPLSHAMVTAAGAYIIPQSVFVIVKLARGGDVTWSGVILNLIVTVSIGALGGILGSSMQARGAYPRGRRPPRNVS